MILIDSRVGSEDLLKPLKALGLDAELTTLDYGDIAFEGKGAGGSPVQIGIELKKLNDLIGSIRSGRLLGNRADGTPGQLPGMMKCYDHVWLLVEGQWRSNEQGVIVQYQGPARGWAAVPGKMRANELEKQLLSLELCGGVHVRNTNRRADTTRYLAALYRWWTDTALDGHTSHLAQIHSGSFIDLSAFRQAVMSWPGIGRKASLAAEEAFQNPETGRGSIARAVAAQTDEWADLRTLDDKGKARRLGDVAAQKLQRFLHGED